MNFKDKNSPKYHGKLENLPTTFQSNAFFAEMEKWLPLFSKNKKSFK